MQTLLGLRSLDRYLWGIFLRAFGLFLVVFLVLAALIDFAGRLDNFLELKGYQGLPFLILRFYLYRIPMFLFFILPVLVLFGAILTWARLTRANEIVPLIVSGISIRRFCLPFLIAAGGVGLVVAFLDEYVLPGISEKIVQTEDIVDSKMVSWYIVARDGVGHTIFARKYDHVAQDMQEVIFIASDEEGLREEMALARRAKWDKQKGKWVLIDGKSYLYTKGVPELIDPGHRRPLLWTVDFGQEGREIQFHLKPTEIISSNSLATRYMNLRRAIELARVHPEVYLFKLGLHLKLAFPLTGLTILLIGLPFILRRKDPHPGLVVWGLGKGFLIIGLYFLFYFSAVQAGTQGIISPIIAGWSAPLSFGIPGLILFLRMRS
jgi:lipopolysaccharide export system permease protein